SDSPRSSNVMCERRTFRRGAIVLLQTHEPGAARSPCHARTPTDADHMMLQLRNVKDDLDAASKNRRSTKILIESCGANRTVSPATFQSAILDSPTLDFIPEVRCALHDFRRGDSESNFVQV